MATRIVSNIRKTSLINSLSLASLGSSRLSSVEHSLSSSTPGSWSSCWTKASASSANSSVRKELPYSLMMGDKLRNFPTWGLLSRGLSSTASLGSIVVQPFHQSSLGGSRILQTSRSFSTSGVYANMRLGFNKQRRNRGEIKGSSDNHISFGKYGLEAIEPAWITSKQITAGQLAIKRNMKGGKLFLRIFPHKPVSLKPAETRMGRGKGNVAFWVAGIKTGRILFEIDGVTESVARRAISVAAAKMPIKTRFVKSLG